MTKILAIIVALIIGAGGVYAFKAEQDKKMMNGEADNTEMTDDKMNKEDMMDKEKTMNVEEDMMDDDKMMDDKAMSAGSYEVYDEAKLAMANEGDLVLFFKASWCPTCRALDADIKASLVDVHVGLTILDVNYDTETALKQKYGVTYQHTLVQVDAQGNLIKKWSGGLTLETIEQNLN